MDPSFELMTWFDGHWSFSVIFISSCGIMTQMLSSLLNHMQMMQEMTKMQIIFMFQVCRKAFLLLIISVC